MDEKTPSTTSWGNPRGDAFRNARRRARSAVEACVGDLKDPVARELAESAARLLAMVPLVEEGELELSDEERRRMRAPRLGGRVRSDDLIGFVMFANRCDYLLSHPEVADVACLDLVVDGPPVISDGTQAPAVERLPRRRYRVRWPESGRVLSRVVTVSGRAPSGDEGEMILEAICSISDMLWPTGAKVFAVDLPERARGAVDAALVLQVGTSWRASQWERLGRLAGDLPGVDRYGARAVEKAWRDVERWKKRLGLARDEVF